MAEYHPQKPRSPSGDAAAPAVAKPAYPKSAAYPQYVEVHVDHSETAAEEVAEHHCYGGGRSTTSRSSSQGSQASSSNGSTRYSTKDSSGKEWWQTGPPKWVYDQQKQQVQQPGKLQPLKRAKDSCDSLCSPFATAALNSKQADMQEKPQVVQSPRPVVSSITRRLSRTLSATAAAATAAAAAATPASLVRAASGKKAQQQKDGACVMSVLLMASHEGVTSCHAGSAAAEAETSSSSISTTSTSGSRRSSRSDNTDEPEGPISVIPPRSNRATAATPYANTATDSAVELYRMGGSSSEQELYKHEQQLKQQLAAGIGSVDSSNRINSRTGLLPSVLDKAAGTSKSKLGAAAAVGAAGAAGPGTVGGLLEEFPAVKVPSRPLATFVRNHPLLVHITLVQLKVCDCCQGASFQEAKTSPLM